MAMDWFSWLSKTTLDPLLTYEYGLLFARNGLRPEDISHFNHDFLQKIGISVAKHRLEILKIAKSEKEEATQKKPSAGLVVSALSKTGKCLRKCIRKLVLNDRKSKVVVFRDDDGGERSPQATHYGEELRRMPESKDVQQPQRRQRSWNVSLSGPLDGRAQERMMMNSKSLKLSGPLDRKERPMFTRSPKTSGPLDGRMSDWVTAPNKSPRHNGPHGRMMRLIPPTRSPKVSGPLDGSPRICCRCNKEKLEADDDYHALWVSLFYDMKPT